MWRADYAPMASSARHTHPGEELVYVVNGTFEVATEGQPTVNLKAGDFFAAGRNTAHKVKNTSNQPGHLLAVAVLERGKPQTVSAPE